MTERPDGTPEAVPSEPGAATEEIEVEAGAFPPETDLLDAEGETEVEAEGEDEFDDATDGALGDEPDAPLAAATGAAAAAGAAVPRRRVAQASVAHVPTQSELAVRTTDNVSRFFVIGTVVVFAAIIVFGMLAGQGGLLTKPSAPTAAPTVSAQPSAAASAAPSQPVEASPSPS
jgi:hypothetical protein